MGDENPLGGGAPDAFSVVFVIIVVLAIAGIIAAVISAVYRANRVAKAGHNPFTLETDLAVKVLDSQTLAPSKSLEQRLQEVDDLLARGVISADEHRAARAAILAG